MNDDLDAIIKVARQIAEVIERQHAALWQLSQCLDDVIALKRRTQDRTADVLGDGRAA